MAGLNLLIQISNGVKSYAWVEQTKMLSMILICLYCLFLQIY